MAHTPPLDEYARRVAPATSAAEQFADQLVDELDPNNGGFTWWGGYSDWKTLTLLSDYLIQLVYGIGESILIASLAAKTHREKVHAEDFAFKQASAQGTSPFPLDQHARTRALAITESAESCFFHLGQALDRLAVAVHIVAGFEINDAMKLDWTQLEDAARELDKGSTRQRYQPVGTAGRQLQLDLVAPILNWQSFGPDDWLPWMRDTRNGMTHRAGAKKIALETTDRTTARVFYRQPKWSELQSLVYGSKPPRKHFTGSLIMSASVDVLDGLCTSLAALIEAALAAMTTCWRARQTNPELIVQHGRQWRMIEPTETLWQFEGYGVIKPRGDTLMLNPHDARRWEAGRVMDNRRRDWY